MKNKNKKKWIDPIQFGEPICYSLMEKGDARFKKYKRQRRKRGFDDSELWSLDCTIAKFILPRLKRYKKVASRTIAMSDDFVKDLDNSIWAFEKIVFDCEGGINTKEDDEKIQKALKRFAKIFQGLWY